MPDFIRSLWLAVRALPWYAAVLLLGLGAFAWGGWHGTRLLGDDNESTASRDGPPGRGGHGRFYHK